MNSLFILLFAAVALLAGYLLYGRQLAKTCGVDPKADTPAVRHNDGKDYAPASRLTVFAHQFSSIAGAGPVQGPILAAVFGWVPALLWLLIGGIFFGAVQDFSALYASVKNDEKYIGKKGRQFFTLFCWLFSLLVIAAFTSMTSSTFNGFVTGSDGAVTQNFNGAAAATISFLFVGCAIVFGLIQKKFPNLKEWHKIVISLAFIVFMFAAGMKIPVYLTASQWNYVIMTYLFIAAVAPMWLLMQPRDYMTTFMFLGMIIGGVVGVFTGHPEMKLNAFNGFVLTSDAGAKTYMFPTLFVTVACGAISGFHSLVSSGTSSKTVSNENDMLPVGYGAMILETLLGVISLIVVGAVAVNGAVPSIAVFMKATNRKSWMFYFPMIFMFCVTFTAIVLNVITNVKAYMAGTAVFLVNGLQLIVAVFLVVLAVIVAVHCVKILVSIGKTPEAVKVGKDGKQAA